MSEKEVKALSRIIGYITDEKGRPLRGVKIKCNDNDTRTLFDGSFRFEGLVSETYILKTELNGYKNQRDAIELVGEEVIVNFQLEPETGDTKIFGCVLESETNKPINLGGSVYIYRSTFNQGTSIEPNTGYFEFNDLPPGEYTLWTSILEYEDKKKTITIEEGEKRSLDFLVRKAELEPPLG